MAWWDAGDEEEEESFVHVFLELDGLRMLRLRIPCRSRLPVA